MSKTPSSKPAKKPSVQKPAARTAVKPGRAEAIVATARDTATKAAAKAEKAAKAGADVAVKFALTAADFAVDQGKRGADFVDAAFEKEFNKRYPVAVANVARVRKAHPAKSPAEALDILASEFTGAEHGTDSAQFADAISLYVLSAVEVHGKHVKNVKARAALVNTILVGTNPTVVKVAPMAMLALSLLFKKVRAVVAVGGAAVAVAEKAKPVLEKGKKAVKHAGVAAQLLEIDEPIKRSIGWSVIRTTRSVLGPPPAKWPAAPKSAPAKPTAKPAAKKPASKPKTSA